MRCGPSRQPQSTHRSICKRSKTLTRPLLCRSNWSLQEFPAPTKCYRVLFRPLLFDWPLEALTNSRRSTQQQEGSNQMNIPTSLPQVVSATELSNSFLGKLLEVCFVTKDYRRTMQGLVQLGIGPWRVYTFDSETVSERTYHGEPADYAIKVCFADIGDLAVEIMQPLYGPSIFQEHLDQHGEGLHHLAFDCDELPWEQREEMFSANGFPLVQSGKFMDQNAFAFFGTEAATTTTFETYDIPKGFVWPEPEEWYPAAPPSGQTPPVREQRG